MIRGLQRINLKIVTMDMMKKLALEAYLLVDKLETLSWKLAKDQDTQNYHRVQILWRKALTRYGRRYVKFQKSLSGLCSSD